MGIEIYSANEALHTRKVCFLVGKLCGGLNHTPDSSNEDWRDTMGVVDIPQSVIQDTLSKIPQDYKLAIEQGFVDPNQDGNESDFIHAYNFLKTAADDPDGICGGY